MYGSIKMPSGPDGSRSDAYRPTSINFINLPNPIEPSQPQAGSQKHPLNRTPHLEKARLEQSSNRDLFKLILDPSSSERPPKRQKPADGSALDLPKLPVRNNTTKRLRIPPTLSGLHQPPPDAGLLPSISAEQPQVLPPRQHEPLSEPVSKPAERREPAPEKKTSKPDAAPVPPPPKARQRRKWYDITYFMSKTYADCLFLCRSDQETEDLLKGVARFGIGSWTKILNCEDYSFDKRTALDLKDRFRVCCPDAYKKPKLSTATSEIQPTQPEQLVKAKTKKSTKGPPREEISPSRLKELGINEPFVNVGRRNRVEYSAEDDAALLSGFKKYGNAWATIQRDPTLGLSERGAADLRDRFRTRYPAEYAKNAPGSSASVAKRAVDDSAVKAIELENEVAAETHKDVAAYREETTTRPAVSSRPTRLPYFSLDDVFLNSDFDGYDDGEPVVLDRGILDWAGADAAKTSSTEACKNTGIDPRMTLKLPKPMSNNVLTALPSTNPTSQNYQNSLPSLASVLPDTAYPDQIELPSFMHLFGSADNDGKSGGGNFPGLEDIMS